MAANIDTISAWEDPFRDFVLPSLPLWHLHKVKLINKRCKQRVEDYLFHNSSIRVVLSPFFKDHLHDQFLDELSQAEAVISGSIALAYFTRFVYDNADMDIFVQEDKYSSFADGFRRLDYRPVEGPCMEGYSHGRMTIIRVKTFIGGPQDRAVQVIQVSHSPVAAVLEFHSTCVMNIITSTHAISFYPKATLIDNVNIPCDSGTATHDGIEGRVKYASRGWPLVIDADGLTERRLQPEGIRGAGDMHCWSLRHTEGSELFVRGMHTWSLSVSPFSNEATLLFTNAMDHDMSRWMCVEGSLHFFMQSSGIYWTDSTYRGMMRKVLQLRKSPKSWCDLMNHRHTLSCTWENELCLDRVCDVLIKSLFDTPLWVYVVSH